MTGNAAGRQKDLQGVLDVVHKTLDDDALIFGGNFNCQIDKIKFLKDQAYHNHAANHEHDDGTGNLTKLEALDMSGRKIYTVSDSKFDMHDLHDWVFGTCNGRLIRKYDRELEAFKDSLHEPNIYFPPTGPYGFDSKQDTDYYLRKAAPAWKERVLANKKAWEMMHYDSFSSSSIYYGLIGSSANIGENKPVVLMSTICLKGSRAAQ